MEAGVRLQPQLLLGPLSLALQESQGFEAGDRQEGRKPLLFSNSPGSAPHPGSKGPLETLPSPGSTSSPCLALRLVPLAPAHRLLGPLEPPLCSAGDPRPLLIPLVLLPDLNNSGRTKGTQGTRSGPHTWQRPDQTG